MLPRIVCLVALGATGCIDWSQIAAGDGGTADLPASTDLGDDQAIPDLAVDDRPTADLAQDAPVFNLDLQLQLPDLSTRDLARDGGSEVLTSGTTDPHWIVVDDTNVYWTAAGGVYKMPKGGGMWQVIAPGNRPEGITINAGRIFWVDSGDGTVETILPDGNDQRILATNQVSPVGVAVDSSNYVYWTNLGDGSVKKVSFFPPNDVVEIASGPGKPFSIVVGFFNQIEMVYWSDYENNVVQGIQSKSWGGPDVNAPRGIALAGDYVLVANYDAGDVKKLVINGATTLASNQNRPFGIAYRDGFAYWTNQGTGTDGSVNKRSTTTLVPVNSIASNQAKPWGIAVDDQYVYWATAGDGKIWRAPK